MNDHPTREADKIVASTLNKIASGSLKIGEKLPSEAKLCQQYEVSRTVIREAIQQLKARGIVNTIVGSGSYIAEGNLDAIKSSFQLYAIMSDDPKRWFELIELRILLESECSKDLAGKIFDWEKVQQINDAIQTMRDSVNDLDAFAESDVNFHRILIDLTENQVLRTVLHSLEPLQMRFTKETYNDGDSEELITKNLAEHEAIFKAISDRDPDAAKTAMKIHLEGAKENLHRYIRSHANFTV